MPPVVLTPEKRLEILFNRIGEYISNPIRNQRIYQSWISGDVSFYDLMDCENIDKYRMYDIFFYPISPDHWKFKIDLKIVVGTNENRKTLIDSDFYNNELAVVVKVMQLKKYHKIIDCVDNMCQVRLEQNPHYRTIQHQMAENGTLPNSQKFLDTYYNEEDRQKHKEWAERRQYWIEHHPIEALNALSRRKKMLISKGLAKPEDFGINNLPEDYVIPNFEQDRLDAIKNVQVKREKEIKENNAKIREEKRKIALENLKKGKIDLSVPDVQPSSEEVYSDNKDYKPNK